MGVLQSSLLQGLLLHLMLSVIHVQIRHPSTVLACHPGLGLLLKIVIVQATPPAILLIAVAFQRSAITNHSFLAPDIATIGDSVQGSPLLLTSGSRLQAIANDFASKDLACHPGLVLPLKIVIVQATPLAILLLQSRFKERYQGPFVPGARSCDNRRLRSRESPSPNRWESPSRDSPST